MQSEINSGSLRAEYEALWHMNQSCNFRCEYCFRTGIDGYRLTEHPECGKYPPGYIAGCFDNTGSMWRIHMTGGEPFLYPDFVELAKALTRNHCISINTNLSTPNVYDFADTISPDRVHSINASLHLAEREKREDGVGRYIEKILYLQKKGFCVRLMYITYPPLLSRLRDDLEYFRSRGIVRMYVKVFRGRYRNELFPAAFTEHERALIRDSGISEDENAILESNVNFFGKPCTAGWKSFHMDVSGNLTRCNTLDKGYGNILTGEYRFDTYAAPCPTMYCGCPYQGLKFAKGKTTGAFAGFLKTSYLSLKQKISRTVI